MPKVPSSKTRTLLRTQCRWGKDVGASGVHRLTEKKNMDWWYCSDEFYFPPFWTVSGTSFLWSSSSDWKHCSPIWEVPHAGREQCGFCQQGDPAQPGETQSIVEFPAEMLLARQSSNNLQAHGNIGQSEVLAQCFMINESPGRYIRTD